MLGPALKQLLSDLGEAADRSPYEEALYRELVAVEASLGGSGVIAGVSVVSGATHPYGAAHGEGHRAGLSTTSPAGMGAGTGPYVTSQTGVAMESSGRSLPYTPIDLGQKDIKRLRCGKSDCPNKRL
jgi:hypothetical protein